MACLLPAVRLSCLERGREIHAYVIRAGFVRNHQVMNALVDMYVKCGALLLACVLFDRIYEKDLVTWTVMIAGYGMHGLELWAIQATNPTVWTDELFGKNIIG